MAKIYVFMADGCEEIEALTPVDILRRAGEEVVTVSIMEQKEITGSHGITFLADTKISDAAFEDGDVYVLPGGLGGTLRLGASEALKEIIIKAAADGKRLAAICAAPSILGEWGLLDKKQAVCYPGFEEKLAGAEVLTVPAVTDGMVTTGRGMGAAVDFSLELLRQLQGDNAAVSMAEKIIWKK